MEPSPTCQWGLIIASLGPVLVELRFEMMCASSQAAIQQHPTDPATHPRPRVRMGSQDGCKHDGCGGQHERARGVDAEALPRGWQVCAG